MDLAAKWFRQNIILETDCSIVASMLSAGSGMRSCLKFIIDEAIEARSKLPQWKIIHKRRESNSVAHELKERLGSVAFRGTGVLSKLLLGSVIFFLSNK
jgi:hypothetical protein